MRFRFAVDLLLLSSCALACARGQADIQKEPDEKQEWAQLVQRFNEPRSTNIITSGMWSLTHAGESKNEVEGVMNLLALLARASANQDPALMSELGGARGFKDKMAAFLVSKDDLVAGFAAVMLGIAGDLRYAPAIAKLLDKKEPPGDSGFTSRVTSRGRAATALS